MEDTIKGISEFVMKTVNEQEDGLYKMHTDKVLGKDMLNKRLIIIMEYMNHTFRALINDNDPYIVGSFNKMDGLKHSKVCLIKIIMMLLKGFYESTDFSGADVSSRDEYIVFVNYNLIIYLKGIKERLVSVLEHECKTKDIKQFDPNEPLFAVSTEE